MIDNDKLKQKTQKPSIPAKSMTDWCLVVRHLSKFFFCDTTVN